MNYEDYKESTLFGRYINYEMIAPLLEQLQCESISLLGHSVNGTPISLYRIGTGNTKILAWSQMHGNESTTTKALFDLLNYIHSSAGKALLERCSFYFIPMLNPDGSQAYTRVNANKIDLNRDAYNQTQPESQCLRKAYDIVLPNYCFNLHDQRTIFSAGKSKMPATISFLAPSYDEKRAVNDVRKRAMEVIVTMNTMLQQYIPNQVGRFDDSFNINCTGDYYTSLQVPTILFESGHFQDDYNREQTRKYVALSLIEAVSYICKLQNQSSNFEHYFEIPENDKLFYDILLRDDLFGHQNDVGILFEEKLIGKQIEFIPYIGEIGNLYNKYGHYEKILSEVISPNTSQNDVKNALQLKEIQAQCVKI